LIRLKLAAASITKNGHGSGAATDPRMRGGEGAVICVFVTDRRFY
jgi:hypothetical protein